MAAESPRRYKTSLLMPLVLIAFGMLVGPAPLLASIGVVAVLAWLLVFDGLAQLACVFQSTTRGLGWELMIAGSYLAAGTWLLIHPLLAPAALAPLLTIFFFAEAVADIGSYFLSRKNHASAWSLADGLITCSLVAAVWMSWPTSSIRALTALLGVKMLLLGGNRLAVIVSERTRSRREDFALRRAPFADAHPAGNLP